MLVHKTSIIYIYIYIITFILSQQSNIIKNLDMGLYRDDGLINIWNPNKPKLDSYRKRISNALKLLGFKITIYTNLKIVNFLDVTLNLKKGKFEPHKKKRMIHPSTYTLLQTTHSQSSNKYQNQFNSSNINIFNKGQHIYNNALKNSSYKQTLKYTPPKNKLKHRNRSITWFNPPYNKCVTSNISRDFLNLISKHFSYHCPKLKFSTKTI